MSKMLFISNITNQITNFSKPSIIAAQKLGYEFHLAANLSNFNEDVSKYNIVTHHVDFKRNPFNFKNFNAYRQLMRIIKNEKIDVIHCNTPIGGLLGRICGVKSNARKIIYTAHGFHFYKGAPLIKNLLFKRVESYLAKFTDTVITINQEDYEAAKKFRLRKNGKVRYVPGVGVDTQKVTIVKDKREELLSELGIPEDSVILISVGELNNNKNHKVIIEALKKLNNSKVHYILCGVGPEKKFLNKLSQKKELSKNVHFLGYRQDIPELLKSADIFTLPSYREGLSRSLMEAMSAGLPCIVSNIRGNNDLISDNVNGFLRAPDDIIGFANALSTLVDNKKLREKMGNYNVKSVKKYDIENVKEEILNIYKEIFLQ